MAGKTLTRADLSEAVHRQVGLVKNRIRQIWSNPCSIAMTDALVTGETVKLSSFGTFMVRQKSGRIGPQSQDRGGGADHAASRPGVPA